MEVYEAAAGRTPGGLLENGVGAFAASWGRRDGGWRCGRVAVAICTLADDGAGRHHGGAAGVAPGGGLHEKWSGWITSAYGGSRWLTLHYSLAFR